MNVRGSEGIKGVAQCGHVHQLSNRIGNGSVNAIPGKGSKEIIDEFLREGGSKRIKGSYIHVLDPCVPNRIRYGSADPAMVHRASFHRRIRKG